VAPCLFVAMTIYYDSGQPAIKTFIQMKNSAVEQAIKRPEFWMYFLLHIFLIYMAKLSPSVSWVQIDWKAAAVLQYFTTFFLTFYNSHCYDRYEEMYPACMGVLDGVMNFTHELTISVKHKDLRNHRLQAVKYMLAATYLFFMGITGDSFTDKEWEELVRKGLLTKQEAILLTRYPGPEVVPILTTWAMYIVGDACDHDCMWGPRKQRVCHIHNRLNKHMEYFHHHSRRIAQLMAMPIPFAYWHLMNVVFAFNFLLISVMISGFREWTTILPYGCALLIFMGLREVSNALADPFGKDAVDFPLVKYLDHVFDDTICILHAFSTEDSYGWVERRLKETRGFTDHNIRRPIAEEALYRENFRMNTDGVHNWNRVMPMRKLEAVTELHEMQNRLKASLSALMSDSTFVETNEHGKDHGADHRFEDINRLEDELKRTQDELANLQQENDRLALADATRVMVPPGDIQTEDMGSTPLDGSTPRQDSKLDSEEKSWGAVQIGAAQKKSPRQTPEANWASRAQKEEAEAEEAKKKIEYIPKRSERVRDNSGNKKRAFDTQDVSFSSFDEARRWLRDTLDESKNKGSAGGYQSSKDNISTDGLPSTSAKKAVRSSYDVN